jgi:hypothetical protein
MNELPWPPPQRRIPARKGIWRNGRGPAGCVSGRAIFLAGWRAAAVSLTLVGGLRADTNVTSCTEAALDAALRVGGRVVFACDGTIKVSSTKVVTNDVVLDTNGRQVTLSGGGSNRIFTVNPGVSLTLKGLTLTQGRRRGADGQDGSEGDNGSDGKSASGGAVRVDRGTLRAVDTMFTGNSVVGGNGGKGSSGAFIDAAGGTGGDGGGATGGAIHSNGGILELTNCVFVSNNATGGTGGRGGDGHSGLLNGEGGDGGAGGAGRGGAIFSENGGTLTLVTCTLATNACSGQSGGQGGLGGGGLAFKGANGTAGRGQGGGLYVSGGSMTVLRTTFDHNTATSAAGFDGAAGAEALVGEDGDPGGLARGGAIASEDATLGVTNCTFVANACTGGNGGDGGDGGSRGFGGDGGDGGAGGRAAGAGLANFAGGTAVLVHCTFSENRLQGGTGGVGGNAGASTSNPGGTGSAGDAHGSHVANDSGTIELGNTILGHGDGSNAHGTMVDAGHNVSSDATPAFDQPTSRANTDPRLGVLAQNGGPTRTVALLSDSPAVNAGDASAAPGSDQRGYARFGLPDVGAYEASGYVPTLSLSVDGDFVLIRWSTNLAAFHLESASALSPSNSWDDEGVAAVVGSDFVVTNVLAQFQQYYRLAE